MKYMQGKTERKRIDSSEPCTPRPVHQSRPSLGTAKFRERDLYICRVHSPTNALLLI